MWFGNWLAYLAGARMDVLRAVPSTRARFTSTGAVLLCTALIAAISFAFAMESTLGSPVFIGLLFGLGWGVVILTMDRALVITMGNRKGLWRSLAIAAPRVVVAIILGTVISTPLVLRIFQQEIVLEMATMSAEKQAAHALEVQTNPAYLQLDQLILEKARLTATVNSGVPLVDVSQDSVVAVAQADYDAALQELEAARDKANADIQPEVSSAPAVVSAQASYDAALADFKTKERIAYCEFVADDACKAEGLGTGRPGEGPQQRQADSARDQAKTVLEAAKSALDAANATALAVESGRVAEIDGTANLRRDEAQARVDTTRQTLDKAIVEAQARLADANSKDWQTAVDALAQVTTQVAVGQGIKDLNEESFQNSLESAGGLLWRIEALDRLGNSRPSLYWAQLMLSLLFISIEVLPVLMKLLQNIGGPTAYDTIVSDKDQQDIEAQKIVNASQYSDMQIQANLNQLAAEDLATRQLADRGNTNQRVVEVQSGVVQRALDIWAEHAEQQAVAQLDAYSSSFSGNHAGATSGSPMNSRSVTNARMPSNAPPGPGLQKPAAPTNQYVQSMNLPDPTTIN